MYRHQMKSLRFDYAYLIKYMFDIGFDHGRVICVLSLDVSFIIRILLGLKTLVDVLKLKGLFCG